MKPVRRLREPLVEVVCTEGSTKKAPWRVHKASSKGPGRNFVGLLHDDACNRVGSILCFVSPKLLAALRNPFSFCRCIHCSHQNVLTPPLLGGCSSSSLSGFDAFRCFL